MPLNDSGSFTIPLIILLILKVFPVFAIDVIFLNLRRNDSPLFLAHTVICYYTSSERIQHLQIQKQAKKMICFCFFFYQKDQIEDCLSTFKLIDF